jgi:hypothetical protein
MDDKTYKVFIPYKINISEEEVEKTRIYKIYHIPKNTLEARKKIPLVFLYFL